ncbi:MAG: class I SAM-dependent methyltransferase [Acidimicrobiales bacterium]
MTDQARGDAHEETSPQNQNTSPQAPSEIGAIWDDRFATNEWPTEPDGPLADHLGGVTPGSAIDLGCGPGRNAIWLAREGWSVTGVDASAVGLSQARLRAEADGIDLELIQADLTTYQPPPKSFDLVVLANMHFSPEERTALFERFGAAVKPGGHFYVSGHHSESFGIAGPPDIERLFTEELLLELLTGFEVTVERHERRTGDGDVVIVDAVAWATAPQDDQEGQGVQ